MTPAEKAQFIRKIKKQEKIERKTNLAIKALSNYFEAKQSKQGENVRFLVELFYRAQ